MLSKLSGQCVQNVELPTWMEQTEMWTRRGELRSIHSIQRKCSFYEVVKTFLPKSLGQRKYSEKEGEKERICSALRTIVDQQKM